MARKGSGGKNRRALRGRGPTPKAEDRVYHKAYKAKQARANKPQPKKSSSNKRLGHDWVVGRNPVLEALQAELPIKAAYVAEGSDRDDRLRDIFKFAAEHSITLLQANRAELDRLTGGAVHQGVALQLPGFDYAHPDDLLANAANDETHPALIIALDQITDPHNLGAIIRSAAAFGAHGVVIPERRSASMTAAAWKASAGAAARIPVARCTNLNRTLSDYAKAGCMVVGLAGEADTPISSGVGLDGPLVLVVGSEGDGLSRLTRERCDYLASIPITSAVESLNASVAAAIALYEVSQVRGG
uniref:23S rRNA (guanosine(2251)-2'-O)-methyltransferase RlmB n=1 Tax=Vaginimicrobium propionicum TaxID=1871034 RepID=UPI0009710046|nr:23S rRNA (guanosine(2251)-2'-O)-methyltransferase RlmB [Vaginimicrobium propionicum]